MPTDVTFMFDRVDGIQVSVELATEHWPAMLNIKEYKDTSVLESRHGSRVRFKISPTMLRAIANYLMALADQMETVDAD